MRTGRIGLEFQHLAIRHLPGVNKRPSNAVLVQQPRTHRRREREIRERYVRRIRREDRRGRQGQEDQRQQCPPEDAGAIDHVDSIEAGSADASAMSAESSPIDSNAAPVAAQPAAR